MLKVLRNLFESWKASSSKLRYVEFIINEKEIRLDSFFFLEERNRKRIVRRFFFFIFILALSIVIFLLPPPNIGIVDIHSAYISNVIRSWKMYRGWNRDSFFLFKTLFPILKK